MSDIIVITNRHIAGNDYLKIIENIAKENPKAIILREKDLNEDEYFKLANKIIDICKIYKTTLILHNFINVAIKLDYDKIHLPLQKLEKIPYEIKKKFTLIGASCHSTEDAIKAESLGANYILAGHIYDTNCKQGAPGRGLDFLSNICKSINIPVYAIGGISPKNIKNVRQVGASGGAIMSSCMKSKNFSKYIKLF